MMSFPRYAAGLLALALPIVLLSSCGGGESSRPETTPSPTAETHSHPAQMTWEPTGEYRAERAGIGLTVFTFHTNWEEIGVRYAIDGPESAVELSPAYIKLTDDLGEEYAATDSTLGTSLGVTAGILIAEPYKGEGKTLTLTVTDVTVATAGESPGETIRGTWSLTFVENLDPGAPVDYQEAGRIAPHVVSAGELTMAYDQGLGAGLIKFFIDRAGQQAALQGITIDSVPVPLTEEEFHRLRAYDPPLPPGFPTPAAG